MSADNEVRSSKLAQRVEEIEKLIRSGVKSGVTSLAAMLESAQAQLDNERIDEDKQASEKRDKEQKDRGAIAAMVERETKLNEIEKKKYEEFLAKEYFTRSDLGDLSRFYADGGAYDRLSENGKEQMDQRVKEGIRRGELSRDELPPEIERKTFGKDTPEMRRGAETAEKVNSDHGAESASENPSSLSKSVNSTGSPEVERPQMSGLEGLANLSPVQESDSVKVPNTGLDKGPRQLGG